MAAIELLTGRTVAPGATLTPVTMNGTDSKTIRNAPIEQKPLLINVWAKNHDDGTLRVRSPALHDNVRGISLQIDANRPKLLLPTAPPQPLIPQDTLEIELSGSGAAGEIELCALLVYYPDLPGIAGRFITSDELRNRARHILTIDNLLTPDTSGSYSGEEALNAETDLLKANTDYALIGYQVNHDALTVYWKGSDLGNLRLGGPADSQTNYDTRAYFIQLADRLALPAIPVINSANIDGIMVGCVQDESGTNTTLTTILAELS